MTKVNIRRLDSVTANDTTATQLINENFTALQTAIENTVSRDGTTPNFMDANLDLNSYKIINAGTPTDNTDVVTKEYFDEYVGDAAGFAEAAENSANRAVTAAQAAQGYSTVATGAANIAQAARDFIESDPGFQTVSADLLLGENGQIYKVNDNKANIDTVADNVNDVNTVAGISSDVTTVAGISTDVTTTADIASDVTTVANISTDVTAVAGNNSDISSVADDLTNIDTVSSNITNVNTVADISSDVTTVAGIASDVSAVEDIASDVTIVSSISSDVSTVAGIASDIPTVVQAAQDIDAVADIASDVTTVAGISSSVVSVAANTSNINAVNANKTNIDAVAGDLTNISAVAADLVNIDSASTYAAKAKQWAIGDPTEPSAGSAKYWAQQSASSQVQADWAEADNTSKAYIRNKPTAGSNISLANNQIAAVSDASPTQNSTNLVQSGGVFTVTNNLQSQIDAIVSSSDVFDIVADYAALQAYDITTVPVNDIVKVLVDSTHDDAATYYRCVESGGVKSWSYVGAEGAYYTKSEADNKFTTFANTGSALDYTGTTLSLQNSSGTTLSSVTIQSSPDLDGKSITKNLSQELQTVGVINSRDSSTAIKTWTGTRAQYDAIVSKDANTLYNITDDANIPLSLIDAMYPVGAIYVTTNATCPLQGLGIGTWTQETSRELVEKKEPDANDPSWYNLYSDGWCEQGGNYTLSSNNSSISISFLKPFNNTNYSILVSKQVNNNYDQSVYAPKIRTRSTTGFIGTCNVDVADSLFIWQACGYTSTTTTHKRFRRVS